MAAPTSYQEQERQSMAQAIAERVAGHVHANEADRLVLIADPKLLGELRSTLDGSLGDRIVLEIDKHLTQATAGELAQRLTDDGTIGLVREGR